MSICTSSDMYTSANNYSTEWIHRLSTYRSKGIPEAVKKNIPLSWSSLSTAKAGVAVSAGKQRGKTKWMSKRQPSSATASR